MKQNRRENLIDQLHVANAILGHTPSSAEVDELHRRGLLAVPHSSYSSEFATWEEAILAAGLKMRNFRTRSKTYSDDELISILQKFVEDKGYLPTQEEFSQYEGIPSWFTYLARFGSIKKAFALAGYDYNRCRNVLSREEMIKMLQALNERLGRIPSVKDLGHKNGVPCRKSFERIFGSWSKALQAAGLERKAKPVPKKPKYDPTILLEDYLKAAEKIGHYPAAEELGKKTGTHCYRTYRKVFGSWRKFMSIVRNV